MLKLDRSTGRMVDLMGSVVFDPALGPAFKNTLRPLATRVLFEGTAEDGTQVAVHHFEANGMLELTADHAKFGTGWDDWSMQRELERVAWLKDFLEQAGTPVGTYAWGRVTAAYDPRGGLGSAHIEYAAQPSVVRDRVKTPGA